MNKDLTKDSHLSSSGVSRLSDLENEVQRVTFAMLALLLKTIIERRG